MKRKIRAIITVIIVCCFMMTDYETYFLYASETDVIEPQELSTESMVESVSQENSVEGTEQESDTEQKTEKEPETEQESDTKQGIEEESETESEAGLEQRKDTEELEADYLGLSSKLSKADSSYCYTGEINSTGLLGIGTDDYPYEIYTYEDFQKIEDNPSGSYILCANIDMGEYGGTFTSIRRFSGKLNGNNKYITGIKEFNSKLVGSACGIFSCIDSAEIRNLNVKLDTEGDEYVCHQFSGGIIAGVSRNSLISCCYANGNLWSYSEWPRTYLTETEGLGGYVGGIVGIVRDTTVDQCMFEGKLKSYHPSDRANCRIAGGIVGEVRGDGKNSITNCIAKGECYSEMQGWCYKTCCNISGGICGDPGWHDHSSASINNCISLMNTKNKGPRWDSNPEALFPTDYGPDKGSLGAIAGTVYATISNCYYSLSIQEIESTHEKGIGLSDDELRDPNCFVGLDFENIWAINSEVNDGVPYLKNVNLCDYSEDTNIYRAFDYSKNISENDIRVPIDKTIILNFEQWANIDNFHSIYVVDESGNSSNAVIGREGCSVYITPSDIWCPNTKYTVVIPSGIFNIKDRDIVNSSSSFSFTTTYLSDSNDAYNVDVSCITMKYPSKYVFWGEDKSVPAIPSNDDEEYVKEFRIWAKDFGYDSIVYEMTDSEIKKILNTEYGELLELSDHSIAKETDTNKTVKDCMRDIIMVQNMQEFLIRTEDDLRKQCDLEHMNESVQEFNKCYSRYLEYEGNTKSNYSSVCVMASLIDYALLFDGLADGNQDDEYFYEFYNTRDEAIITPSEIGNYMLNILNISIEYEDFSNKVGDSFNLNVSSEQLKNSRELLSTTKKYGHLIWDIFDTSSDVNATDLVKEIVKDNIDLKKVLAKLVGIDTSSVEYKCIASSVESLKKVGKYMAAGNSFLMGLDAIKMYYEVATGYYHFIDDQYPSWLFMNVYYMSNASPETYENIWGSDDDFLLEYGQGAISNEEYVNESDNIVKLLKGALLDNGSIYNIYTYQDNYVRTHNIWGTVDIAQNLSEIRRTNINSCASVLVTYGINEYNKNLSNLTYCKVACPTDVQIINVSTGEVEQTISTGMEITNNVGQFGSFYLTGDNLEQKYIALNEGYTIKILPTADGKMDCDIYSIKGEKEIFRNVYDNLDIKIGEEYNFDMDDRSMYLTADNNTSMVTPTNKNNNTEAPDKDSFGGNTEALDKDSFGGNTEAPDKDSFGGNTGAPDKDSFGGNTGAPDKDSFDGNTGAPDKDSFGGNTEAPDKDSFGGNSNNAKNGERVSINAGNSKNENAGNMGNSEAGNDSINMWNPGTDGTEGIVADNNPRSDEIANELDGDNTEEFKTKQLIENYVVGYLLIFGIILFVIIMIKATKARQGKYDRNI